MRFGSKSLGKSLIISMLVITAIAVAMQSKHNYDIRGKAEVYGCIGAGGLCGGSNTCCTGLSCKLQSGLYKCAAAIPTPTPVPSYFLKTIFSGTCAQTCLTDQGTCASAGYDGGGTNGQKMSYDNWKSCTPLPVNCTTTVNKINVPAKYTCLGGKPEWVVCRCLKNQFVTTTTP